MKTKQFYIGFSLFLLLCSFLCNAQEESIPEPPSKQNTYFYSIQSYERQPKPPKYMRDGIDVSTSIPQSRWRAKDSLFYAYEQVHLESFEFALSIFSKLNTDTLHEPHAQQLYRTTLQQTKRFEELYDFNKKTLPEDTNSVWSVKKAALRLCQVYIAHANKSWKAEEDTIFNILYHPETISESPNYRKKMKALAAVAKHIDSALRLFVFLKDDRDRILSEAFEEFGDFQHNSFYVSNAYLCYAIARHYYRNDRELTNKYNRAIDEISKKNYLLPSFRNLFGKVINNRHELEEELTAAEKTDTLDPKKTFLPPEREKKKDYLPWLDYQLIILSFIFVLLILVLFVLKTDHRK